MLGNGDRKDDKDQLWIMTTTAKWTDSNLPSASLIIQHSISQDKLLGFGRCGVERKMRVARPGKETGDGN
jgi:hypothetical protein